jgi:transcriptional regulator with XRE-family HTH domain
VNLAQLFEHRRRNGAGSLRDMEQRAASRGTPISKTTLGEYASGKKAHHLPTPEIRIALANALDVDVDQVMASIAVTAAPELLDDKGRVAPHSVAWLLMTEGRSEDEINHVLAVVEQVLKSMDAVRDRQRDAGQD